eukprot:3549296-Pyramimonas_sp.AAC.1
MALTCTTNVYSRYPEYIATEYSSTTRRQPIPCSRTSDAINMYAGTAFIDAPRMVALGGLD